MSRTVLFPALRKVVTTAECDSLAYEGEYFGKLLRKAGVDTTITRYNDTIHGFFDTHLPGGQASQGPVGRRPEGSFWNRRH